MSGWLRRGAAATSLASERGDLWPAGTLAAFVYLGWLPFLVVVAPPNPDDLAFIGISLVTSSAYPANVIALAVAAVSGFILLVLLAGFAEVGVHAGLCRVDRLPHPSRASLSALAVLLVGTLPAVAAGAALTLGITARAAAEFTSPQVDVSVFLRLAAALWPFLAGLLLAILAGQALGGTALRLALRHEPSDAGRGLGASFGHLRRHPGAGGVAAIGWLKDIAVVVVAVALLRVLWAPIAEAIGPGVLSSPATLLLLVGFVAIWLALLVAAGALHVAVSAWWAAELDAAELAAAEGAGGGGR